MGPSNILSANFVVTIGMLVLFGTGAFVGDTFGIPDIASGIALATALPAFIFYAKAPIEVPDHDDRIVTLVTCVATAAGISAFIANFFLDLWPTLGIGFAAGALLAFGYLFVRRQWLATWTPLHPAAVAGLSLPLVLGYLTGWVLLKILKTEEAAPQPTVA